MNHALEADYLHTRERLGLDPGGLDALAARMHARLAGRVAAGAGSSVDEVSGHVARFPLLMREYAGGFAEASDGSISEIDTRCLEARIKLDSAVRSKGLNDILHAVEAVFEIAADFPDQALPHLDHLVDLSDLAKSAATYRADVQAEAEAVVRRAEWEASLPAPADLKKQLETEAAKDGDSFDFHGYTLWAEPEYGGWSLTNAYGIDDCAFLSTEKQFALLIEAVRKGEDIGPVPPYCQDPPTEDDWENSPQGRRFDACLEATEALIERFGIHDEELTA